MSFDIKVRILTYIHVNCSTLKEQTNKKHQPYHQYRSAVINAWNTNLDSFFSVLQTNHFYYHFGGKTQFPVTHEDTQVFWVPVILSTYTLSIFLLNFIHQSDILWLESVCMIWTCTANVIYFMPLLYSPAGISARKYLAYCCRNLRKRVWLSFMNKNLVF